MVPSSSIVDLKAELLKKSHEFQLGKGLNDSSTTLNVGSGKVLSEDGVVLGGKKFKVKLL